MLSCDPATEGGVSKSFALQVDLSYSDSLREDTNIIDLPNTTEIPHPVKHKVTRNVSETVLGCIHKPFTTIRKLMFKKSLQGVHVGTLSEQKARTDEPNAMLLRW